MPPKRTRLRPPATPPGGIPAPPAAIRTPLSPTEAAFVQMAIEEHTALVRQADAHRNQRVAVLLKEKGIPDGTDVTLDGDALVYLPKAAP